MKFLNKIFAVLVATGLATSAFAQNVGIGQATPVSKLHVTSTTTDSDLRITNGTTGSTTSDGFLITVPNSSSYVNFLQKENAEMRFSTNNAERGRITGDGQLLYNTTSNGTPASNLYGANARSMFFANDATYTHGVFAVSNQNGGRALLGYNLASSGTTGITAGIYGRAEATPSGGQVVAVQGSYLPPTGSGDEKGFAILGISTYDVNGTAFFTTTHRAVEGQLQPNDGGATYAVGTSGDASYNFSTRSGGVLGTSSEGTGDGTVGGSGVVGYYSSGSLNYSLYGFGDASATGVSGGFQGGGGKSLTVDKPTKLIGIGLNGGIMGGWVNSKVYGMHLKGQRYSLYVDGNTVTNKPIAQLVKTDNGMKPTYAMTSELPEITLKGSAKLVNGEIFVPFTSVLASKLSGNTPIVVTVTPMGQSNGLYLTRVDNTGFWVKENGENAHSDVLFNWIAIGTNKDFETMELPKEILTNDFETKMDGVMFDDINSDGSGKPIWWDGKEVRFDEIPKDIKFGGVKKSKAIASDVNEK